MADAKSDTKPEENPEKCLKCHAAPIEYRARRCGHWLFCQKCAMKCATGGKCKVCGEMYVDLQRK